MYLPSNPVPASLMAFMWAQPQTQLQLVSPSVSPSAPRQLARKPAKPAPAKPRAH